MSLLMTIGPSELSVRDGGLDTETLATAARIVDDSCVSSK